MGDFQLTQSILGEIGWGYVCLAVVAIGLALVLPKSRNAKATVVILVLGVASIPLISGYQAYVKERATAEANRARLATSQAVFEERCKTAGEKIYRTVENVDEVLVMNLRPDNVPVNDQFARWDPYGYESGGADYIESFLPGHWRLCTGDRCPMGKQAFKFIESKGEDDVFVRYTTTDGRTGTPFVDGSVSVAKLRAEAQPKLASKYGVRWDDISTDRDRQSWIAGGKLSIYEVETMTVIAERTGFFMDPGQGSTKGARAPWS